MPDNSSCPRCGKVATYAAGASLTSWIFRDSRCRCSQTAALREPADAGQAPQLTGADSEEQALMVVAPAPVDMPESLSSRFEVISRLGTGGMGTVFRVKDNTTGRQLALKVMRPDLSRDEISRKRFLTEAKASTLTDHPNVIEIFDYGLSEEGIPFILMEYVDGSDLEQIFITDGVLPIERTLDLFIQISSGLEFAHSKGVVHRDVKPSNMIVFLDVMGNEKVKIADFGIARITGDESGQKLTQTGQIFGSPYYMSPEQCEGLTLDERSDIYSLGCTLYESLTGKPPFSGNTAVKTLIDHITERPAPLMPQNRMVSEDLERVVLRCLEKDRDHRYQTMKELNQDLELIRQGTRLKRYDKLPKPIMVTLLVLLLIAGSGLVFALTRGKEAEAPAAAHADKPGGGHVNAPAAAAGAQKAAHTSLQTGSQQEVQPNAEFEAKHQDDVIAFMRQVDASVPVMNLGGYAVKDSDFKVLPRNRRLRDLRIDFTPIGDEGFKTIGELDTLERLHADHTKVTNKGIAALTKLPGLLVLEASHNKLDDGCTPDLGKLKELRELTLRDCRISDRGIRNLAGLKNLLGLQLDRTLVTDDGIKTIVESMPNLKHLHARDNSGITSRSLEYLARSKSLRRLTLSGCSVSPQELQQFFKSNRNVKEVSNSFETLFFRSSEL